MPNSYVEPKSNKNFYFRKIQKRTKNQRKIITKNIRKKDLLIGFVIDVITWIILLGLFAIYVIYQKVKMCFIISLWGIAIKHFCASLEIYFFVF